MDELDAFDRQILQLMKRDSRRTGEQLSALVGLSSAACLRRVQRLRKSGAIEREIAIVSKKLENRGVTIIVLMQIERHDPRVMDSFCKRLQAQDEVIRLNWVTGEDDIIVILECQSMNHFDDFCEAHLNDLPVVGYKTMVSMRAYETGGLG